jgi:hypothetical protein
MTEMRVCTTKGVGFAVVACLTTVVLGQGGDNAGSATPYTLGTPVTGTTVGFNDVSDEVCPYTGSTSPDVYYSYVPTTSHNLTVELCESGYDTKVYVYDSSLQLIINVNNQASCNDDACTSTGGGQFRSLLNCVPVTEGLTYYIVVDGWEGDAGPYAMNTFVTEDFTGDPGACAAIGPCILNDACPPGATIEGEPCDDSGTPDEFNGGCNSPNQDAFGTVACEETICGQAYFNGTIRDTDWFQITTDIATTFTWDALCEFEGVAGRVQNFGIADCTGVTAFGEVAVGGLGCDPLQTVSPELPPGDYWFFVGPAFTATVLCGDEEPGNDWIATLTCVEGLPECPWDLDDDMDVDFQDLLRLLSNFGPCPGTEG